MTPEKQSWERLRQEVSEHAAKTTQLHGAEPDRRFADRNYDQLEARVRHMELRLQKIELDVVARMEALAASYAALATAFDSLANRVVTRPEFDTVRFLTFITAAGLAAWIAFKLASPT